MLATPLDPAGRSRGDVLASGERLVRLPEGGSPEGWWQSGGWQSGGWQSAPVEPTAPDAVVAAAQACLSAPTFLAPQTSHDVT